MKRIYIICPVRRLLPEQKQKIDTYVAELENKGYKVCLPYRDVKQTDPLLIVKEEVAEITNCDEVHIFWDNSSFGSHFDLGVAMGLARRIVLVESLVPGPVHSYETVIKHYEKEGFL